MTPEDQPTAGADPHSITSPVSLQEMRPRILKHDDAFVVLDRSGDARPMPQGPEGLYWRDTRHLSQLELLLAGQRPLLLSSAVSDDGAVLTCDLSNPDLHQADGLLRGEQLHIRRSQFLRDGCCFCRITLTNFAEHTVALPLVIRFDADFADLFEVRGTPRARRGAMQAPMVAADEVRLGYLGLDAQRRTTTLRFDPAPAALDHRQARYDLVLAPGVRQTVLLAIDCREAAPPTPPRIAFLRGLWEDSRQRRATVNRLAGVASSDAGLDGMLRRSIADLGMLTSETPQGPYPYAGIPWFSTAFGRDALVTAWLTLWLDPSLALGVLRHLAALQATTTDAAADAEPGKILHEARDGEMARLGEVPFRRYYGSVDSTPLFVALAGAYLQRTGDAEALRPLWPNLRAALDWLVEHGDRDGDGFIEYGRQTEAGLANQGWKDSWDSVSHVDGTLAQGPIALCEVQAYAYAAFLAGADIAAALGKDDAAGLRAQAHDLRARFMDAFWCEQLGSFALALDGRKQPCLVRASNAGHALLCGIATASQAEAVTQQLTGGAFHSGWGIRTLAVTERRYNPMSYHNGSVWPHDNALIGLGFARYGHRAAAARLLDSLAAVANRVELQRLPELFCGFPRRSGQAPTAYPVACSPQAWAAAAPIGLLGACLGLSFDPKARLVRLEQPALPAGVEHLLLRNLSIGEARIDVELRRAGAAVAMSVPRRQGEIGAVLVA